MTRNLCCLVLTCLVTACAPRKAVEVPEAAVTPPKRNNNNKQAVTTTDAPPTELPRVVNPDGMVIPDNIVNRLPDRNDMTPTAPPATPGGGVIATPPAPRKPVNE